METMNDNAVTANENSVQSNDSSVQPNNGKVAANTKPRKARSDQDQRLQNGITQIAQEIQIARSNPRIAAELVRLGFDSAALDEGVALANASQNSFTRRQVGIGAKDQKAILRDEAERIARRQNTDFREVVRIAFTDPGARRALGTTSPAPRDRQTFITSARAAYATAATPAYASAMQKRGYDAAALAAAHATVDNFADAITDYNAASNEADDALIARNVDYTALRAWAEPFRRAVRRAESRG